MNGVKKTWFSASSERENTQKWNDVKNLKNSLRDHWSREDAFYV